ncbi:MAG: MBL fold metallo-hydrolase [Chitinophagia bacterium]|jgi:glyoxylase-like metal-dependent hydrolase (beta-lactamase superfamily II)
MLTLQVFTFSPIRENTYILFNEQRKAIIIDPGCYFSAEEEMLKNYIQSEGLKPEKLLNTHCHLDHVFGNRWVHETYGLELHIHAGEQTVLERAPISGDNWGLPFTNYSGPLHFLKEQDVVYLGNDQLQVIEAPGHSPASICFYCAQQEFLIAGDVLFRESIGRTDIPGANQEQLLTSIREKLWPLPDTTTVYPGHGGSTTIGHEKAHNPFL